MRLKWQRVSPNEWRAGDYMITRWYANDRGNRLPQYSAYYRPEVIGLDELREAMESDTPLEEAEWTRLEPGISLNPGQKPFRLLTEAKRVCQQHAEWLQAVERGREVAR